MVISEAEDSPKRGYLPKEPDHKPQMEVKLLERLQVRSSWNCCLKEGQVVLLSDAIPSFRDGGPGSESPSREKTQDLQQQGSCEYWVDIQMFLVTFSINPGPWKPSWICLRSERKGRGRCLQCHTILGKHLTPKVFALNYLRQNVLCLSEHTFFSRLQAL